MPSSLAFALLMLVSAAAVRADDAPADAITGLWLVDSKDAVVRIVRVDDHYEGRLAWLKEAVYPAADGPALAGRPVTDRHNPDPARRSQPLLGLRLLWGLHYDGEGHWRDGRIYNADDGRTYHCQVYLPTPETLKLRGFIGIALFGASTLWTRLQELPPQVPIQP